MAPWAIIARICWLMSAMARRTSFEFNVEVCDPALAACLAADFDRIRDAEAEPVTPRTLAARSLPARLRDGFARLFAPIL